MTKEKRKCILRLCLRIVQILVLALVLWGVLAYFLDEVSEGTWEKDMGRMVGICDGYYYERDYAELREELTLYNLYSEEFGKYWEAVEGYQDYLNVLQWSRAEEMNLPQSEGRADAWREKLEALAAQPEYPENRALLQNLVKELP